ncbi:MAG: hypothetical protein ACJAR2_002736 [Ilumatobacter sp.]|jgi:hypothetical protein
MTDDAPPDSANNDVTAPGADLGPDQGEVRERRAGSRGGRRRGGAPSVSTISWRDIPAQLTARGADDQHKVLLHARFQHAIDRAAAVGGLTATNDYVQHWGTDASPLEAGDVLAQLDRRCAEIEGAYPRERLEALVANGGLEPASGNGRAEAANDTSTDAINVHPTIEDINQSEGDLDPT